MLTPVVPWLVSALLVIAGAGLVALLVVLVVRAWKEAPQLREEFTDPQRGPQFFFLILALCVVGIGLNAVLGLPRGAGIILAWSVAAAWFSLLTAFFLGLTFRAEKSFAWPQVNPGWLLPGASAQGVAILGLSLPATEPGADSSLVLGCFLIHLAGLLLLLVAVPVMLARWLFGPVNPQVFGPANWINLGALGIAARASAGFVGGEANGPPASAEAVIALLCWSLAVMWSPLLVVAGYWRHFRRRVPFSYAPENWALVFSPSIFGVATIHLRPFFPGDAALVLAAICLAFAAIAWVINATGFFRTLLASRGPA